MNGQYVDVLSDCSAELQRICEWIEKNRFDSNVKFLISYATIKASGTIELVLKQILFDSLACDCKEENGSFLIKHLVEASFNATTGKIEQILEQMSKTWKKEFTTAVNGRTEKSDLNSLIVLRNQFAHGTPINSSIETITKYFDSGRWVLDALDAIIINPERGTD